RPKNLRGVQRFGSGADCALGGPRSGIIGTVRARFIPRDLFMLLVGRQYQRTCQGLTRRAFLQAGGCSLLGLSLADLLRLKAVAAHPGSTRSVIFLWLWGGPSHLDTWDPKPDAPSEFRGPFASIPTKVP